MGEGGGVVGCVPLVFELNSMLGLFPPSPTLSLYIFSIMFVYFLFFCCCCCFFFGSLRGKTRTRIPETEFEVDSRPKLGAK